MNKKTLNIDSLINFVNEGTNILEMSPTLKQIALNIINKKRKYIKNDINDEFENIIDKSENIIDKSENIIDKRENITEEIIETDPLNPSKYKDYVDYNESEIGDKYNIKIKKTTKTKIIAEGIFRMHNRNERLPEYLSGILCTVNNLHSIMGSEWGYRIYIDTNFLKKNIIRSYGSESDNKYNYNYDEFKGMRDYEKWIKLFNHRDEGIIFAKFLKQLNTIDYVEIYNVVLTDTKMIDENGYPVGLFGTNYRFHASLDTSKDIVYMKDGDWAMSDKVYEYLKLFEKSEKLITYYFFPWYKPPTHAIIEYPFTIIAYFWGLKPKLLWSKYEPHYSFDTIINYFLNFSDDEIYFFNRTNRGDYKKKASYGSDEIILTDLIFSGFKTSDTYPYAQQNDLNSLLLFYVIYETYKDDTNFKKILNDELVNVQKKIVDNEIKNIKNWNTDTLENFLFGDTLNNNFFCCILPLYNKIPNINQTKIFYMAYLKSIYELVCNNDNCKLNFRDSYYHLISENMKLFDSSLTDEVICQNVFNHTFSNNSGWSPSYKKYILPNDDKYEFNHYYNIKPHIPAYYNLDNSDKEPFWGFITNVIFNANEKNIFNSDIKNIFDILYNNEKYSKPNFIKYLWGPNAEGEKIYTRCVENKKLNLLGGYYRSYALYGSYDFMSESFYYNSFSCEKGHYDKIIKTITPKYNVYLYNFKPILLDNKVLNDNILNLSKYNFIINSTINPRFHAITWKILSCIIEKTKTEDNFLLFDSGNALSHLIYNQGEFPWDDDIDIGYITDAEYKSFFELLKSCLENSFTVYIYKKIDKGKGKWHENMEIIECTLTNINEFNKDNVWFAKISIKSVNYKLIESEFNIPHYKFKGNHDVIPWIDIMPYVKNSDNTYSIKFFKELNIYEKLNEPLEKVNIFNLKLNKPVNLKEAVSKYKKEGEYFTKDNIYNHISNTSKNLKYDTSEKQWLINYVDNHNLIIDKYLKEINCDKLINNDKFKQKYLKYKQKYIKLKKFI